MNIKNLDNQLFSKNNYISKMVSDGIITLADVEKYNPEIIELYKEYLINSEEINDIYIQIFGSFEKYVEFSIGEEVGWYNSKKILETFDIAHGKKYFYELLKKVIESTPNVNGFDIGDFCLKEYCDNFNLLSDNESRELLLIMNRHSQIINSKKNHDEEFKNKILDLFKTTDYDYLIRAIENGEEILPF